MLLMKKHLVALIRAGRKRQTLRYWSHPRVQAGRSAFVPGLGPVLVESVEPLSSLRVLTRADARAEGFATLAALRAELGRIYGPRPPAGRTLYRVRFVYPAPAAAPAASRKPAPAVKPGPRKAATGRAADRRALRDYLAGHPLNRRH